MNTITKTQDDSGQAAEEMRIKELEEEHMLLFKQLQVVQEELERLHQGGLNPGKQALADEISLDWVDDRLPEVMAENLRYRAILETQREVHRLEAQHTLAGRLGDILIQGTASPAALLAVPAKLLKIRREEKKQTPPSALGGEGFERVIAVYREGGLEAAEALLASVSVSATLRANALTVLARGLMYQEPANAAAIARRAYAIEPRPFRLKWLAFRLYEAGELTEAEAMLEALPPDTEFSDSETRQASQLHNGAKQAHLREAKQKCGYSEHRAEIERQWADLAKRQEEQAKLAVERGLEIERLEAVCSQSEQEKSTLAARSEALQAEVTALAQARDEQSGLAAQRQGDIETLRQAQARLEQEKTALTARSEALQVEVSALAQARDEQSGLAARWQGDIETLRQAQAQLEQEKSTLAVRSEALQAEVSALAQARDEQSSLAAQRQGELLQLTRTQTALEKEKAAQELQVRELERQLAQLAHTRDEQTQLLAQQSQLALALSQRNSTVPNVDDLLKKQTDNFIRVRNYLESVVKNETVNIESVVKRETVNAARQIEAFVGLQHYFVTGELPNVNIERHNMPVSPDFAFYLAEILEINDYDLIIEFGSGISTVIVARILTKISARRQGKAAASFVSFEHLDQYYKQTHSCLAQAGLADAVQLNLAPLQDWLAPDGNTYSYYGCQAEFSSLAEKYAEAGLRLLAIVDGPPAATGKHARYPAGPLLLQHFSGAHIDILLDDYIRDDEKEIAQLWQAEMQAAGREYRITECRFEKEACLISVSPRTNTGEQR